MDRKEFSKITSELLDQINQGLENSLDLNKVELKKMIINYLDLILELNLNDLIDIKLFSLVSLLKDLYYDNYIIQSLIKELELKINRISRNISKDINKNDDYKCDHNDKKDKDKFKGKNVDAKIEFIDGKYVLLNKDEINLPKKGEYFHIIEQNQINGKRYVIGKFVIDWEGNIVDYIPNKDYFDDLNNLDSIYSNMDDNLVYHDDDYLDFISKNEEEKQDNENHEAPKPEFTSDIDFDDHDCDYCDEDCHDTFDDDRRKVIKRKKSRKAKEADL